MAQQRLLISNCAQAYSTCETAGERCERLLFVELEVLSRASTRR